MSLSRLLSSVAQHFRSSGMSLNERFGMYQRKAAQMEMMKQRKSPEIHRYERDYAVKFAKNKHGALISRRF